MVTTVLESNQNVSRKLNLVSKELRKGMVIFMDTIRGFGFIQTDDGKEIFFHAHAVIKPEFSELREGNIVSFYEVETNEGRSKGIGVELVKKRNESEVIS